MKLVGRKKLEGLGWVEIAMENGSVKEIRFLNDEVDSKGVVTDEIDKIFEELEMFLCGKRKRFEINYVYEGTDFQKSVWKALEQIGYGTTVSYGELARRIGKPRAVRAVGTAVGKNPLPVLVPCHRVVGKQGLGGYSGGLDKKQWLLSLENGVRA